MTSQSLQASEDLSAQGATHPRVSLADMNAAIQSEHYINAGYAVATASSDDQTLSPIPVGHPLDLMTICFLTMTNGFVVLGKSAPASPENYDQEKGRTFAREDAIRQLWPLMGFELRQRLHRESATA